MRSTSTRATRWVTVFRGSMAEALVLRGLLESNDLVARILDENIKVIDPFITGANALDVELQVPEELVAAAREVLDYRPPDEPGEVAEPDPPADREASELVALGWRIRMACLLTLVTPYALWLARDYFARVRRLGRKPEGHGWTIAGLVYAVSADVVLLAVLLGA